jgi:hypothetical protein
MHLPGAIPDRHDDLVLGLDRHAVAFADGKRVIGIADIHGNLPQLAIEPRVDFVPIEQHRRRSRR